MDITALVGSVYLTNTAEVNKPGRGREWILFKYRRNEGGGEEGVNAPPPSQAFKIFFFINLA